MLSKDKNIVQFYIPFTFNLSHELFSNKYKHYVGDIRINNIIYTLDIANNNCLSLHCCYLCIAYLNVPVYNV